MENEIKIEGFTPVVPNEIYARERANTKEVQTVDPETWQQATESVEKLSTDLLMLSIASLPSRQETLERIAQNAQQIVADVSSGKLQASDSYKGLSIDQNSGYSPAQQVLLCMPYNIVEILANAVVKPELAKDYIEIARMSYPLSERNGKPVENDGDLDLIKIVFMAWDTNAFNNLEGDKADANFYWGLLNPMMKFKSITLLVQDGKLEDKEIITSQLKSGNLSENLRSAMLSAVDAVYSCNLDDMTDKSAKEWRKFTYVAIKTMYEKLSGSILDKMKVSQEKNPGVVKFTKLGSGTTFASALEKIAAEKKK